MVTGTMVGTYAYIDSQRVARFIEVLAHLAIVAMAPYDDTCSHSHVTT